MRRLRVRRPVEPHRPRPQPRWAVVELHHDARKAAQLVPMFSLNPAPIIRRTVYLGRALSRFQTISLHGSCSTGGDLVPARASVTPARPDGPETGIGRRQLLSVGKTSPRTAKEKSRGSRPGRVMGGNASIECRGRPRTQMHDALSTSPGQPKNQPPVEFSFRKQRKKEENAHDRLIMAAGES